MVSTGRPGHVTPTGVFTVLQMHTEHRSTIYDGAPMPYMERLTWGGIALHAGGLPGYPEAHGCIHLPSEFARLLFAISPNGMTVVIGSDATAPESVAHPGYLAPVKFVGGQPVESQPFMPNEEVRWHPELSPSGPISIVLSQGSQRIVAYRNGIEIGRARVVVSGDTPLANHVLVLTEGPSSVPTGMFLTQPDIVGCEWGCPDSCKKAAPKSSDSCRPDQDTGRLRRQAQPGSDTGDHCARYQRRTELRYVWSHGPGCRCGSAEWQEKEGSEMRRYLIAA